MAAEDDPRFNGGCVSLVSMLHLLGTGARESCMRPERHIGATPSARRRRAFWATSTPARSGHLHHDLAAVGLTFGSRRGPAEPPCSRMLPDQIRPDLGTTVYA